ncbi:hypothetical protein D3C76_1468290 [compost metagenome]
MQQRLDEVVDAAHLREFKRQLLPAGQKIAQRIAQCIIFRFAEQGHPAGQALGDHLILIGLRNG